MKSHLSSRRPIRKTLTWIALLVAITALAVTTQQLSNLRWLAQDDFIEYWAAGRLNIMGENPYDETLVANLQVETGRVGRSVMMWNPPWSLAVAMPFACLPFPISRLGWYLFCIAICFGSASWLWTNSAGEPKKMWIVWILAFTFAPTLHVLRMGQIAPLLLLGIVGFWFMIQQRRDWAAGALSALEMIKPHLLYLFLIAIILWAIYRRRWGVLAGFVLALSVATGIAWLFNPNVIGQYYEIALANPLEAVFTPTIGGILRYQLGVQQMAWQFLPSALGTLWLIGYAWTHRSTWDWNNQLPIISMVSIVTTSYGWVFDLPVSLTALLPAAVIFFRPGIWQRQPVICLVLAISYTVINLIVAFTSMEQSWYWWFPSFLFIWFFTARRIHINT